MLKQQGLYSPQFEHDNCGAGFICSLRGEKSNDIIHKALQILKRLEHRGAVSADGKTGDGAGILIEIPHEFFLNSTSFKLPAPNDYAVGMVFLPQKKNQREIKVTDAQKISNKIISMFHKNEFDVCTIFYSKFKSVISQEPIVQQIIPVKNVKITIE